MNLFRIAAYVLTDWPVMPSAVLRRLRLAPRSPAGHRNDPSFERRLHILQMHGSPDSMRPLGGSGGEHRADKVH
jgi:hypothetical protein